jgi:hypothetical protein
MAITARGRISAHRAAKPRLGLRRGLARRSKAPERRVAAPLRRVAAAFGARRAAGFRADRAGARRVAGRTAPDLAVARRLPAGVAAGVLT